MNLNFIEFVNFTRLKILFLFHLKKNNTVSVPVPDPISNRLSDLDMHPHKQTSKTVKRPLNLQEETSDYWMNQAKSFVDEQAKRTPNTKKARNVIMFLGDGMSHYSLGNC